MIIMKTTACLSLFLIMYIGLSSAICTCGKESPAGSDVNIVDDVNNAEGIERINNKLGSASEQMCVGYSIDNRGVVPIPKFKRKDVDKENTTNTCKPPNSDGSIDCIIEDPYFSTKDECYPAQYFCVHQVKCPSHHRAVIQCSSLNLPKSGSECLDALRITSQTFPDTKEVCGYTYSDCFPDIHEAGGNMIRITFTSGLCCQNCGYRLWVRCVPQPKTGLLKKEVNQITSRKTTIVVNVGEVVTFSNYYVRIKSGTKTRWIRRTTWLYVQNNVVLGVGKYFTAKRTTTKKFPGYGKLTIYSGQNRIYYEQLGIPPREKPSVTERKFIRNAQLLLLRYSKIKSNIPSRARSFLNKFVPITGLPFNINKGKRPTCQARGETSQSLPNKKSQCDIWGPNGQVTLSLKTRVIARARSYTANNKKPIVNSIAKLILKHFAPKPQILVPSNFAGRK